MGPPPINGQTGANSGPWPARNTPNGYQSPYVAPPPQPAPPPPPPPPVARRPPPAPRSTAPPKPNVPSNNIITAVANFKSALLKSMPDNPRAEALVQSAVNRVLGITQVSTATPAGQPEDPQEKVFMQALNSMIQKVGNVKAARQAQRSSPSSHSSPTPAPQPAPTSQALSTQSTTAQSQQGQPATPNTTHSRPANAAPQVQGNAQAQLLALLQGMQRRNVPPSGGSSRQPTVPATTPEVVPSSGNPSSTANNCPSEPTEPRTNGPPSSSSSSSSNAAAVAGVKRALEPDDNASAPEESDFKRAKIVEATTS